MLFKILTFLAAAAPIAAAAQTPPVASVRQPAEFAIPNSRVIDFTSSVNGHLYRINIALPTMPAPSKGYRVIYIFDGGNYFGSVVEAVRMNGNAPDVVVVGIGYPDSPAFAIASDARHGAPLGPLAELDPLARARERERQYDLTLPTSDATLEAQNVPPLIPLRSGDVGGLDALLETIEKDIKPRIATLANVDPADQTLFGHSLGGLAVLRALFTEPDAFRTFVIASPSIWWNDRAVLADERRFAAKVAAGKTHPRVLITVGANEGNVPSPLPEGFDKDRVAALIRKSNMVGNARDLAARLAAIKGSPGYDVAGVAVFPDQDHGISVWPAIGSAVEFAFQHR